MIGAAEEAVEKLKRLGLTDYQARTLAVLLKSGEMPARQLAVTASVPITKLYTVLDSLSDMGLIVVSLGRPKVYRALEAATIAEQLIKRQEKLLQTLKQEKEVLVNILGTKRQITRSTKVEYYGSADVTWNATWDLCMRARRTLYVCAGSAEWATAISSGRPMKIYCDLIKRGVTCRYIISRDMAELFVKEALKQKLDIIRCLLIGHVEHRSVDPRFLSQTFVIRDEEEVGISFKDENGYLRAGLHIFDSSIARGMVQFFENLWSFGQPINLPDIAKSMVRNVLRRK